MNNHLIPEARVDKNGVTSIKHVRPEKHDSSSQRSMPVPTIAPTPVPVEAKIERPDYGSIIEQNQAFLDRSEPVLMMPADLVAFAEILDYARKEDDDGYDKVWSAGQLIKQGNSGAAKTILSYIREHQATDDYTYHGNVFDAWVFGCNAGVFEEGRDYSATPRDQGYFAFITKTFELSEYDYPMNEVEPEVIQRVADIYHALDGKADAESVAEYWEEREDLEGYLEYAAEHNATRDGVL